MLLALLPFELLLGSGGQIVAPPLFIVETVVFFPLLFIARGIAVVGVSRRYRPEG